LLEAYDYAKVVASFLIVALFLYGIYYYLGQMGVAPRGRGGGRIRIVETRMVGKNRYLILAEVEGDRLLLASDENGVKILKEWPGQGRCEG